MTAPPKVLYFVGKGRSGTTLLDNVLGQLDGFVSTGEITKLWTWGFDQRWRCGCGRSIPECPFWQAVINVGFAQRPDIAQLVALQERVLSWWKVPRLLAHGRGYGGRWEDLERFAAVTGRVYEAIAEVSGARVIVDSSKWPASPTALGLVPGVQTFLLHLVRDPRAVVHSWRRRKVWTDREVEAEMPRYSAPYSMASYAARNAVAEALVARRGVRALRLRYEDLAADPAAALRRVLALVDEPMPEGLFADGPVVRLAPTHTAGGNPNRLATGVITIRPDERWRLEQSRRDRLIATVAGAPFLWRYGYPLRPGRDGHALLPPGGGA
ncbi:MAG: sulfotransferase [Egibacteraceae bacterium]